MNSRETPRPAEHVVDPTSRPGPDPAKARADRTLLILTAAFVAALAIVAGAISFAHMRELAIHHDQLGWTALAFPISVDGLEIVASLYLVAQRRAGRPTGWIPWVALVVGTLASLAANIAVGGADPIAKALAGWPAVSMLASVKLLFSMIDHSTGDQLTDVPDDQWTPPTIPETVQQVGPDEAAPSRTVPGRSAADGSALDMQSVAHLILAARAAHAALVHDGRPLSRDNLADTMRANGHGVSNARASLLLKILKADPDVTATGRQTVPSPPTQPKPQSDKVA